MNGQKIIIGDTLESYEKIADIIAEEQIKAPLLVCGESAKNLAVYRYIQKLGLRVTIFSQYAPNPAYASVVAGVKVYQEHQCDGIIGLAGGSGLDVAKCIKMYATMKAVPDYLQQSIEENGIPMIAIPTTAGTGSESTRYSIIYVNGVKQTITHDSSLPKYVFLDGSTLHTLPDYQRKATMLDALSHAVESYWSCNSTEASKKYAREAILKIMDAFRPYMDNTQGGNSDMLYGANLAGRAIHITGTTAAHAMCYKLTKQYGLAHGHAVAITLPHLWQYMIENIEKVSDPRGKDYVWQVFEELAVMLGFDSPKSAADGLWKLLAVSELKTLIPITEAGLEELVSAVDVTKLQSNPVKLDETAIKYIYKDISVI